MKLTPAIVAVAVAALLSGGCANRLYFGTHTSLGLDVSGTSSMPDHVTLSSQRFEGAIVPQKADGTAHSVLGKLDADITWFNGQRISQTFATGVAAQNFARLAHETPVKTAVTNTSKPRRTPDDAPLIFVTRTTFGLDIGAGGQDLAAYLLLGYKRQEATVIPIRDATREVRSVYADVSIDTVPHGTNAPVPTVASGARTFPSTIRGARIVQTFATGEAAELLTAHNDAVREKLRNAIGASANVRATGKTLSDEAREFVDAIAPGEPSRLQRAIEAARDAQLMTAEEASAQIRRVANVAAGKAALMPFLMSGDAETNRKLEDFMRRMKAIH